MKYPRPHLAVVTFALALLLPFTLQAAPLKEARVTQVINDVNLLPGEASARRAAIDDEVRDGTAVRTGVESRSELTFSDQTLARLGANTIFSFNEGTRSMELGGGAMLLRVPKHAGGAKITTAAVTAAITGTTVMMQYDPKGYAKFIVLEGTACVSLKGNPSNCVPVKAGQLLAVRVNPPPASLPTPIDVDLQKLIGTSALLSNDFAPLPSLDLIATEVQAQNRQKAAAEGSAQNAGSEIVLAALSELTTAIDQRTAVEQLTSPTPTPTVVPVTPTPTPTAPPTTPTPPPSSPSPTPQKFGTPSVITSATLSVIDSASLIQTDPSISRQGETGYGKIYRGPSNDGPPGTYLFGSTSSFDNASAFAAGSDAANLIPIAVFKFPILQLAGNPTISTQHGGASKLALIGQSGITTAAPGGALTFHGLDTLLLATQDGSITLGSEISITDLARVYIYARGAGRNLRIDSSIETTAALRLYSQGTIEINGDLSTRNFSSFNGGDFLRSTGLIIAETININSLGNLNFVSDRFSGGSFSDISLTLRASNALNLDLAGDLTIFHQAGSISVSGRSINLLSPDPVLLTFASGSSPSFNAGTGGIQGLNVDFAGDDISLVSAGDIRIRSFDSDGTLSGSVDAVGDFEAVADMTLSDLKAGGSITIGGQIIASTIRAGGTIDVGGRLAAFDSVTAGGDITADTVAVPNIVAPNGVLRATGGGIFAFVVVPGGSAVQHTFTVARVVSPNGIDFSGNQFDGIDGLFAGGKLTINADTLRFDADDGVGEVNFNGADGLGTTHPSSSRGGGDGGVFVVHATGDIFVGERISATTGENGPTAPAYSGAGGTVTFDSAEGTVTVANTIQVSSNEDGGSRRSASGGNIYLRSGAVSGSAIRIESSAQLFSLLDGSAPGTGGTISILADTVQGNESAIEIDNTLGSIAAERGTIDIRHLGNLGLIALNSANLRADVIKIGALGNDGTLTLGGGTISAETILRLYAGGSNGSILFTRDITLGSNASAVVLAAPSVTIQNGVVVTIGGSGGDPAQVFTNLANYSGFGGNNSTTGTFAGAGATTSPFSDAPPFDSTAGARFVTYSGASNGNWSNPANWTPMVVPNNGNGGRNYDAEINSGTLTQDIASGVTLEQLFMNGGTLRLTNPLSLNQGLQFAGGAITLGTLNLSGNSSQAAQMVVNGTTINNSGNYLFSLTSGDIFSGSNSTFNNSGTLTKPDGAGTLAFNLPLQNSGLLKVDAGILQLTVDGSSAGVFSAGSGAFLDVLANYAFTGASFSGEGQIRLGNNRTFTISGTINNAGTVLLNSSGNFTDLSLAGNTTLSGTGLLRLTNADRVRGSGILTNAGNTIAGETSNGGSLGANEIGLINQAAGVIEADVSGLALNVDPNSANGLTNGGTMQASGGGLLLLNGNGGGEFNNAGGTIRALDGAEVRFANGATVSGGTLNTAGSGLLRVLGSAVLADVTNRGLLLIANNSSATFRGQILNSGNITVGSDGNYTDLFVDGNTTFSGTGLLNLRNAARVRGSGTLFNGDAFGGGHTIQGETSNTGSLGTNEIGIVNRSGGTILANVAGLVLDVDPSAAGGFVNQGVLSASDGGLLVLNGNGGGAFDNQATISALTGSEVRLTNGVSISGGNLSTAGTGVIRTLNSATLSNLTNTGSLRVSNNTSLTLAGNITNSGNLLVDSQGNYTDLFIDGTVTLTGSGTLTLQNAARVRGSGTLFNGGPNGEASTIVGETSNSGSLGTDELAIVNRSGGLIQANVAGAYLLIDPRAAEGLVNQGNLRASGGGFLRLSGNGSGSFENSGGTISALDASEVQLSDGAFLNGGTLSTAGSGVIRILNNATLSNLTNTGFIRVSNNTSLTLAGNITNSGNLLVDSQGNFTDLLINGPVTLTGSGRLTLQNAARVRGIGTLFNGGPNGEAATIVGETSNTGSLGADELTIVNRSGGLIDANVSINGTGLAFVLDPSAAGNLSNTGTMRASGGGILHLTGNGGGVFNNNGGTISALDASQVELVGGATIIGGTLSTSGTGTFRSSGATLNGVTNTGAFLVNNNTALTLSGTFNNSGDLRVNSAGNFTDLLLSGDVTLSGTGTLTLANADRVRSAIGTPRLTNASSHTIRGETSNTGSLGTNEIALTNQGTIDANISGLALVIDPAAVTNAFSNTHGLVRATSGGIISLTGNGGGEFDNTNGQIIAFDLSEVQLSAGAALTGGFVATQGTGVIRVINTASFTNLQLAGNFISNNSSSTTFAGTINNTGNVTINSQGNFTDLFLGGATLTGGGNLFLTNADRARGSGVFTNVNNVIQGETNNGGSFGANEIGIINQAGGRIDASVSGQILDLDPSAADGLTNAGTMQASNGGILRLNGNGGGNFSNSGTIRALSGGALQFNGAVTSSGTVDVGAASLTATGSYTQSGGTFLLAGGSVQSNNALVFQGGLVDARGTITAAIQNNAILRPALGGSGLNVTGNVSLLASSQLVFQLGGLAQGSQYGFLNVNGNVSLGGQLAVSFVNNFVAAQGNSFTVLSSTAALSGTFSNVASGSRLTTSNNSGSFLVNYGGNTIVLSDYQGASPKPEAESKLVLASRAKAIRMSVRTGAETSQARLAMNGGHARPIAVNVENSDRLLDLLEKSEPAGRRGKVAVNAARLARASRNRGAAKHADRPNGDGNSPRSVAGGEAHPSSARVQGGRSAARDTQAEAAGPRVSNRGFTN